MHGNIAIEPGSYIGHTHQTPLIKDSPWWTASSYMYMTLLVLFGLIPEAVTDSLIA